MLPLCYLRGVYGDVYAVINEDPEAPHGALPAGMVLVGNLANWAPSIQAATDVLDNIGRGLYTVVNSSGEKV
jgi:hypothetical protein